MDNEETLEDVQQATEAAVKTFETALRGERKPETVTERMLMTLAALAAAQLNAQVYTARKLREITKEIARYREQDPGLAPEAP